MFPVTADATVKRSSPSGNSGSTSKLGVDGSGDSTTKEAYLKFSVSGLTGPITGAKVRVYAIDGSVDGPGIYTIEGSWSESSITWQNRPPRRSKLEAKGALKSGWQEYNVSAVVTANGTYSFALAGENSDGMDFYSREGSSSLRAQLVVTTGIAPSPSPSVKPSPSPSAQPSPIPDPSPEITDPLANAVFNSIGDDVVIDGVAYSNHSAFKDHSIRRSQNGKIYRFEVRQGEAREGKDSGRDRSELRQKVDYSPGTDLWVSYSFMLEKGAAITGNPDNVLTQWHGGAGSPPLSIRVPADNTLFVRNISGSSSNGVNYIPYTTQTFQRGKWYNVVQHLVFDSEGQGVIEIWINGQKVVDVKGRSTTYSDSSYNYWKFGIYRDTMAPIEVVYYANMEAGTKNLADRVAHPLQIAP